MFDASDRNAPPHGYSVRYRLLAICLLPMLVVLPLLLGGTIVRWNAKFSALLITKVSGDLTIAHQYLSRILENTGDRISALGESAGLKDAVLTRDEDLLSRFLAHTRTTLKLDFLYVADSTGRVISSAPNVSSSGLRLDWPVIQNARNGVSSTVIDIFAPAELAAITTELKSRAYLDLVPTPNAAPTDRQVETRGMVIQSASPLRLADRQDAVLVGGTLLNGNLEFIDSINDLVYRDASLPEGSRGTATLFLDDVRITTNVRLFEGKRALGTRVSNTVRTAVLDNGRIWLDRAFVVNDWYISAYEPIIDSYGKRVGMLYVGFLETPFTQDTILAVITIALAFLLIVAATVPIFLGWARSIFEPIERVTQTITKVEAGDFSARTRIENGADEIGRVAVQLDKLLDQIQLRDRELRDWNAELNRRVDERTRDLQAANQQIEATMKQLVLSEKLAAIGEVAAGVAHEIINPIAVMQGNLEVACQLLGPHADVARTEFDLIDQQTQRISDIVVKLLQFARPEEFAEHVERHDPASVITDSVPLVQHVLSKPNIEVVRHDATNRLVLMNKSELQQVLVNLIINAIYAMPDGGRLTLRTFDEDFDSRDGVVIEVQDTGHGMSNEVLARIFDPFFTTKSRDGNGLGLSISQKLINRIGGRITVVSRPGHGTTFTVWLPAAPSCSVSDVCFPVQPG
ncbi:MAG: cache domain-containing protein [Hyphomicrobium aestuarii]|nr:cache domain-containing protein [Hyphomicrobium aestuarii]